MGPNDDKSCLGPFRVLCVAGVGPKKLLVVKEKVKILTNNDFVAMIDVQHLLRPVT